MIGGTHMVREIMHDPIFLAQKSVPATNEDAERRLCRHGCKYDRRLQANHCV